VVRSRGPRRVYRIVVVPGLNAVGDGCPGCCREPSSAAVSTQFDVRKVLRAAGAGVVDRGCFRPWDGCSIIRPNPIDSGR